MQSAIYQLALIIGLGTLAVLLLRDYSLLAALYRSGMVLVGVLILLVIAGNVLRIGMRPREREESIEAPAEEPRESATRGEGEGD